MTYDEDDYLMISGIQHFCFCKRQWALIHMEQEWADDGRTVSGNIFHEKADTLSKEKRRGIVVLRSVRVSSSSLGLSGRCDVVEIHEDSEGFQVDGMEGTYSVIPVEYKVGHRKESDWDRVQLCAESIALEESLHTVVQMGYLFYGSERRRECVPMNNQLREFTIQLAEEMHRTYEGATMPSAVKTPMCKKCSLFDICMPEIDGRQTVNDYMRRMIDL